MPDENTTDSTASNASGLPTESVENAASAMTDEPPALSETAPQAASDTPDAKGDVSSALVKAAPQKDPSSPRSPASHQELRLEPRMRVRWHADAFIDGKGIYQGFVKDISLKGTDIFLDINLQKVKSIKVRIHVPPLNKKSSPHIMEVSGKVVYTAYDSAEFLFHTGVKFLQFDMESDLALLQSRIASFNRPR